MNRDRKLVQQVRRNEPGAFERFIDAYGARIHGLAQRYAVNQSDAEDLVQEIFLDLYRCLGFYRAESALATWVYRVAINHCLRYQQRLKPDPVAYDETRHATTYHGNEPEATAIREDLRCQVRDAVDHLPPLHREVVILHELHGLTYQQCADVLDVPVGTVKSRLANSFTQLRKRLGDYVSGTDTPLSAVIEEVSR